MIKYIPYTLFDAFTEKSVQAIVNTVNCVGAMGKGLALEIKLRYPDVYDDYKKKCDLGAVSIGKPYTYVSKEKIIVNFPTKDSWKLPSRVEYIESGLDYFRSNVHEWGIKSIAFPKLGCSQGGLTWSQVKPIMEKYLNGISDAQVFIYLDSEPSPSEKELLTQIKKLTQKQLTEGIGLTKKQAENLQLCDQIIKFRDLLSIKNVGPVSYKKILNWYLKRPDQKEFEF